MKTFKQKIVIFAIIAFLSLATISCDLFNQNTTQAESTLETTESTTTVVTTTVNETTTLTNTTQTTSVPTTTQVETTLTPTTTEAQTTTVQTTTPIPTTTSTTTNTTTTTSTTTTTTYPDQASLQVTSPTVTSYEVYDTLNLTGMVVTFIDDQSQQTTLTTSDYIVGDVDMTTYGTKQVTITYGSYSTFFVIEVNLPAYYANATDKTGNELLLSLRTIINYGFSGVSYGDARYILDETDADPSNPNNLILVYLGTSIDGDWNYPNWNREHVWPQSALPDSASNGSINTCSDLQNLKPSDVNENSSRGNKYFDNATTSTTYEPRDEVKGDIARIMLYMVVMYDELSLIDGSPNLNNYEMAKLSVLLEWHALDPVDDFEMHRNDVIYSYQNNRNPFIDYPAFVDMIWD